MTLVFEILFQPCFMARMCLSVLRGKLFISLWPLRSRPQLWWTALLSISFSSVIFIILTFTDVWLFLLLAYEEISNLKSPLLWAHKPFVLSPYHPISGSESPWDHCQLDNLFSFLDSCFFHCLEAVKIHFIYLSAQWCLKSMSFYFIEYLKWFPQRNIFVF